MYDGQARDRSMENVRQVLCESPFPTTDSKELVFKVPLNKEIANAGTQALATPLPTETGNGFVLTSVIGQHGLAKGSGNCNISRAAHNGVQMAMSG